MRGFAAIIPDDRGRETRAERQLRHEAERADEQRKRDEAADLARRKQLAAQARVAAREFEFDHRRHDSYEKLRMGQGQLHECNCDRIPKRAFEPDEGVLPPPGITAP